VLFRIWVLSSLFEKGVREIADKLTATTHILSPAQRDVVLLSGNPPVVSLLVLTAC